MGIQPALPSETGHFFLFLGIFPVSWECSLYSPLKQGILFIPNILGMQSAFFHIPSQEYSQYPGNAAYPPRQHISIPRKAALLSWSPRRLHFIASHCISLHFIAFHLQECWEQPLDITAHIPVGRKQSKQNSPLCAVEQGPDPSIFLELLWCLCCRFHCRELAG